jgi:hypothetical protein
MSDMQLLREDCESLTPEILYRELCGLVLFCFSLQIAIVCIRIVATELTSETKVKGIGTFTIATLETRTITVSSRACRSESRT